MREKITLEPAYTMNDKKLQDSLNNLRNFYADEGYNEASITPEISDAGNGDVNVTFKITENLRLRVNSVDFKGNTVFYNMTLQNAIKTHHSYLSWLLNTGIYNPEMVAEDKINLRNLYWTKGYLDFRVTSVDVKKLKDDPEYVNITFNIEEGKPYTVDSVTVSGNRQYQAKEILPGLEMQPGQIFDYRIQQKDIHHISMMYYPLGYADFTCEAKKHPNFQNHTVRIDYSIQEGKQYEVRDINISGNFITKDKVIRRELPIQPGDPVDNALLEATKARLMGIGYFKDVIITTASTPDENYKDINIKVQEKKTIKFTIGAGYADTDGFGGVIEISQNNFDLFDPANWFMGGGQRLQLKADVGFERNEFLISFTEPWLFDIPLKLNLSGYYTNRYYDKWKQEHAGGSISFTKKFFDDFTSISLGHRLEYVRVYDMDDDLYTKYFEGEEGSDILSTTSLTISRDTRDSLTDPKSGYLLSLKGAFNAGSKVYYRLEAVASNYYPFFEDLFVLHTGIKCGTVDRISGESESGMVPIYERYFLGGGDTLRGFPYRKVGPEDRNEDVYGGQSMVLANVEVTHPIWDFIRGAAFIDAGGAFKREWDVDFDKINMGAGYGLRVKLPHFDSPIKLDLAYPILNNQDGVDSKLRFSFSLGFAW